MAGNRLNTVFFKVLILLSKDMMAPSVQSLTSWLHSLPPTN